MLKLTSLALGLLTVMAIAPASQAATNINPLSFQTPASDLHSQVIIKLGGQSQYHRGDAERRRELEREREREAAARRRYRSYGNREYRGNDRGEYRRDR